MRLLGEALARREAAEELRWVRALGMVLGGMFGQEEAHQNLERHIGELLRQAGAESASRGAEPTAPATGGRRPPPWRVPV